MIRTLCYNFLDIQQGKIIGMDVSFNLEDDKLVRGDKLIYKTVKELQPDCLINSRLETGKSTKAELISQEIGEYTILSFGNSSGDIQMHECALNNPNYHSKAFMVVGDDVIREYGYQGEVLQNRIKDWGKYTLISMANDWKTIYGDNVTKS